MNDQKFIYWDDLGDSQEHVDQRISKLNACAAHARDQEWEEKEEEMNRRMDIIGQNGATAEGYMKTCVSCKIEKAFIDFPNNTKSPDGKHSYCKTCSNQKNKEWRQKNSQKNKDRIKRWKEANADRIKEYKRNRELSENEKQGKKRWTIANAEKLKQYRREYKKKNQKRLNEAERIRKQQDPVYRAICSIRSRVSGICKNINVVKDKSVTKAIGISRHGFKKYIESKFVDGMTWDNYGDWHIDHIIPISTAKTLDDVMALNNYKNLQPLWWIDNLIKGSKYDLETED